MWRGALTIGLIAGMVLSSAGNAMTGAADGHVHPASTERPAPLAPPAGATLRGRLHDSNGPVAGAVVVATASTRTFPTADSLLGQAHDCRSADDGTFSFVGLDADTWYRLTATDAWHHGATSGGRPGEGPIEMEMTATGHLVVTLQGGEGASTVACRRTVVDTHEGWRSQRDGYATTGSVVIDLVVPGTWICEARSQTSYGSASPVLVRAGAESAVAITMAPRTTQVVQVLDAVTGAPIAGATVWAEGSEATKTGADGSARLVAPLNQNELSDEPETAPAFEAVAPLYGWASADVPVRPQEVVTIRLTPLPLFHARVVDASGTPVAGAVVLKDGWPRDDRLTDADGRFAMPVEQEDSEGPEEAIIGARRVTPGVVEEGSVAVPYGALPSGEVTITLLRKQAASLTVHLVDASAPVAGAALEVRLPDRTIDGRSDDQGALTIPEVIPGDVVIRVPMPTGGTLATRSLRVAPGEQASVSITLTPTWTVDGRAVSDGAPLARAEVGWTGEGEVRGHDRTSADGSFRIGPIPGDVEYVRAFVRPNIHGAARTFSVKRGADHVVVDFTSVIITGHLATADGDVPDASIDVACGEMQGGARSDGRGRFTLDGIPASAPCDAIVRFDDGIAGAFHLDTPASGKLDIGDVLLASRELTGHATSPTGHLDGLFLRLALMDGRAAGKVEAERGPDGSFRVRVPAGRLRVLAWTGGVALGYWAGVIEPDAPLEIHFAPSATLEVAITRTDGLPATGTARLVAWNAMREDDVLLPEVGDGPNPLTLVRLGAGHVVVAVSDGSAKVNVEADLIAGQTTRVPVTLP